MILAADYGSTTSVVYNEQSGLSWQLSGLSISPASVGVPLQGQMTLTNKTAGLDATLDLFDYSFQVGGVATDPNGIVIALFAPQTIQLGPYPPAVAPSDFEPLYVQTQAPLPASAAGQTLTVYAGDIGQFGNVSVGSPYYGGGQVLSATVTVSGAPSSTGSGSGQSYPGSGGSTQPPSGTGTSTGTTTPTNTTTTAAPSFWSSLSTTEKVAIVGGGLVLAGGAYVLLVGPR